MPEPDVAVVRGTIRDYLNGRAKAEDLSLVVEVADSSAGFDTYAKLSAYAGAAIPVYWIVYLKAARIIVFGDPSGPAESPSYRSRIEFGPGEDVPVVIDGAEIARIKVNDLLP
jgi:Uma2 family endonuclease